MLANLFYYEKLTELTFILSPDLNKLETLNLRKTSLEIKLSLL